MNPSYIDENTRVKSLSIHNQIVNYLPKFTETLAQRLEVLWIESCQLKVVSKEDLRPFPKLLQVSLPHNDLEWLDGDLFDFNPQLGAVLLNDNEKLMIIGANFLNSLRRLWLVNLRSAGCINYYASDREYVQVLKDMLKTSCKGESHSTSTLESTSSTSLTTQTVIPSSPTSTTTTSTTPTPSTLTSTTTNPTIPTAHLYSRRLTPVLPQVFLVLSLLAILKPLSLVSSIFY